MAESPRLVELQQKFEDNPRRYFASLANEYRKAGDVQRAISICRIYLEKQRAHTAGHVVLGQALYASGKIDEAAEVFRTVLTLDPENLIALKCLGDIAQDNGEFHVAHENFRKVITADPRDHDTSGRLRVVEQALKLAALASADDWIPPRSDEFALPDEPPPAFATEAPPAALPSAEPDLHEEPVLDPIAFSADTVFDPFQLAPTEPDRAVELEPPVVHGDLAEDDFVDTLMPSYEVETEHHSGIAEPVDLESSESSLAVPDLTEEADSQSEESAFEADQNQQYRTAEFTLPDFGSTDPEISATSTEMESEAGALMDEAELALRPPPLPFDDFARSQNARTGEYSLSRNTSEWNIESVQPAASAPDEETDAKDVSLVEPAGPFITETVAELYLQQGFTGEALLVYRQLARAKPGDQRIADRIAELERRLGEEHAVRQAALDVPYETLPEPHASQIPAPALPDEPDDWFAGASAPVPPIRARQTVHEFFALLGRAKPEVRRKPERKKLSAEEIRAAADITAGFGAFGMQQPAPPPPAIPASKSGAPDPQDDVRRFRAWLDGLSDS